MPRSTASRCPTRSKELTIVTPSKKLKAGVFAADESLAKSKGQDAANLSAVGLTASKVVGRLGRQQGDKWPVRAGARTLQIELGTPLKIKVSLSDGHLISAGDHLSVTGTMVKGQSGNCLADEVDVTLKQPLSGPPQKVNAGGGKPAAAKSSKDKKEPAKTEADAEELPTKD